jgi:hypothetical protein
MEAIDHSGSALAVREALIEAARAADIDIRRDGYEQTPHKF